MALFKRKPEVRATARSDGRDTARSDAGGIVLWSRAAFADLTPETWDDELCEDADIKRHIEAGDLVPIFVGFDGAFEVDVRHDNGTGLTDRERRHLRVSGRGPYRLVVGSGGAWVSGLEHVGAEPWSGFGVGLEQGVWSAELAMIAWDDEPGAKGPDGKPSASAMSDFVVLVRPANPDQTFATEIEAFERSA